MRQAHAAGPLVDLGWADASRQSEVQLAGNGGLLSTVLWDRGFLFGDKVILDREADPRLAETSQAPYA